MGFKDDLAAAKAAVDAGDRVKTVPIPVVVNGKQHELVFYRAGTAEWAVATIKHPPRDGVALDARNGYDLTGATREIAPEFGRLLEDGGEVVLSDEEWADLWEVMAPSAARMIEANVWHVHERDAELELESAKKGSAPRPASRKKSS